MDMESYYGDLETDEEGLSYFERDDFDVYEDVYYPKMSFWFLCESCIFPVIQQTVNTTVPLMLASFVCKLVSSLSSSGRDETAVPKLMVHISSALFGLYILYNFFQLTMLYLIISAILGYIVITITMFKCRAHCGTCISLLIVVVIISLELFIVDTASWHKIRGSQMIMSMKIISLAFDISNCAIDYLPDIWQYLGYVFNVGTVIFGPWINFQEYCNITQQHLRPLSFSWMLKLVKSCIAAMLCLVISSCFLMWIILDHHWKWFLAYRDAMSFRFSHYFVCYLSTVSLTLNGFGATESNGEVKWDLSVTRPSFIELPRSLVETVSNWNLPMHYWLKIYIFKNARPLGNFAAVLLTYGASSLLHGLNFQLAAVLLSLGFYSYIEHVLRGKLARIFDACILAKTCKENCNHLNKANNPYVIATNVAFVGLSMFHLTYLGLMFDSSSQEETGYDMAHTLAKWSSLDYLSHWVACGTYFFHLLI